MISELKMILSEQETIVEKCMDDRSLEIVHGNGNKTGGAITPRESEAHCRVEFIRGVLCRLKRKGYK